MTIDASPRAQGPTPHGPGKHPGYAEPQPEDGDDARHGGKNRRQSREDGGLERNPDGGGHEMADDE